MADIQTVTTKDAQLEIFGSKVKADINPDTDTGKAFWEEHPGAIVFPTDENKVYFGGAAYDGFNDADLQAALSSYVTKNDLSTALADYVKSANFASLFTTQLNAQLPTNTKFKAVETQASTNASNISTLDNKVDTLVNDVDALSDALGEKQDKLTAGDGISIENNVISSTFDLNVYRIVSTLPTIPSTESEIKEMQKHIYLVVDSTQADTTNKYIEYILVTPSNSSNAVNGAYWEKLGEYKSEVDLTPYLKKSELNNQLSATLEGVTAADNNGTQVTIEQGTSADKTQIKAAIIIQ